MRWWEPYAMLGQQPRMPGWLEILPLGPDPAAVKYMELRQQQRQEMMLALGVPSRCLP